MKIKNQRIILGLVLGLMLVVVSVVGVSATEYSLLCLEKGETVYFSNCHPLMEDKLCRSDGYCSYCAYVGSKGFYCPANINQCNAVGATCTSAGNDTNGTIIDRRPPIIDITSPLNDTVYDSRRIYVKGTSNKVSYWYYKNHNDRRPKWKKICSKKASCSKRVSFDEGENDITIRAVDTLGNIAEEDFAFTVDSKEPKIKKTYPRKGFADGTFEVEFDEENPVNLTLHYGGEEKGINPKSCADCRKGRGGRTICTIDANVSEFDGQIISYWFTLTDIAGSEDESKHVRLQVDTTAPVIKNLDDFYEQDGKYIYFDIEIDEKNLDAVEYIDWKDRRPKWKKLCSRLRYGACEKKKSFKRGLHEVDVQVVDEAGNAVSTERISFGV